jgi:hypothetical protein
MLLPDETTGSRGARRAAFLAAATVLRMTHTSVTGPIPPGTGVMARTRGATA